MTVLDAVPGLFRRARHRHQPTPRPKARQASPVALRRALTLRQVQGWPPESAPAQDLPRHFKIAV